MFCSIIALVVVSLRSQRPFWFSTPVSLQLQQASELWDRGFLKQDCWARPQGFSFRRSVWSLRIYISTRFPGGADIARSTLGGTTVNPYSWSALCFFPSQSFSLPLMFSICTAMSLSVGLFFSVLFAGTLSTQKCVFFSSGKFFCIFDNFLPSIYTSRCGKPIRYVWDFLPDLPISSFLSPPFSIPLSFGSSQLFSNPSIPLTNVCYCIFNIWVPPNFLNIPFYYFFASLFLFYGYSISFLSRDIKLFRSSLLLPFRVSFSHVFQTLTSILELLQKSGNHWLSIRV